MEACTTIQLSLPPMSPPRDEGAAVVSSLQDREGVQSQWSYSGITDGLSCTDPLACFDSQTTGRRSMTASLCMVR